MELLENNQDILNFNNSESDSLQTLSTSDFNDQDLFQTSLIDESNYLVEIEAEEYYDIASTNQHEWSLFEDDTSSIQAMQATPDIGFNTNDVGKSPQLDYIINFKEAGNYYAWVLGRAAGESQVTSDSLHLGLNGQLSESTKSIANFSDDYSWSNTTRNKEEAMIEILTPGIHTLNLWMREDGFMVDKVILTTEANFDPYKNNILEEVESNSDTKSLTPSQESTADVNNDNPLTDEVKSDSNTESLITRQESTANIGYDNPPFSTKAWRQSWGAGQGLAPQMWFWEDVPKYQELKGKINEVATERKAEGRVPYAGLQLWRGVFEDTQSGEKYSELPGHQAWVEWIEARPEYLGVDKDGDSFDWGYVSPLVPLNKEDYPEGFEGDVAYYADWQADRLGRLAEFTGIQGFVFSDFFDSHPHTSPYDYFNPLIIKDFEKSTDIKLSSNSLTDLAQEIRSDHAQEWLDYWVDRWAYNWSAIDREINRNTEDPSLLITQTSFTPAGQRRFGAVDPRVVLEHMSPDNIIFDVQTVQGFMMRKLPIPESYESASIGLHAAREPEGYYGHLLMSSEDRYWEAVDELWPDLDQETQQELGWKRLKRTWLESGWTHVATREGDVRRAAESWTRSYHDKGEIDESWVELLRDIDPTRPFGPAIYYSVPIERAYESHYGANGNILENSYLGSELEPVTDLKENDGVPFNYFVSDAALSEISDEFSPTAWIIPDRYLEGKDLLPTEERKLLETIAPIISEEEAQNYDYSLSFNTNEEGRTINGFGFYDQNERLIVVASDQISIGESDNNLEAVQTTIDLELTNGSYVARDLLNNQEIAFEVSSGSGKFTTTIDRWDTRVFEIVPASN